MVERFDVKVKILSQKGICVAHLIKKMVFDRPLIELPGLISYDIRFSISSLHDLKSITHIRSRFPKILVDF